MSLGASDAVTFDGYTLVPVTSTDSPLWPSIVALWYRHPVWADGYHTYADYYQMQSVVLRSEFCKHHSVVYAMVKAEHESTHSPLIYGTCWIYQRKALYMDSNSNSSPSLSPSTSSETHDHSAEPVWSLSMIQVPAEYQSKGYGSRLMKLIFQLFHVHGVRISTLYSDIDVKFYEKFGYVRKEKLEVSKTRVPLSTTLPSYNRKGFECDLQELLSHADLNCKWIDIQNVHQVFHCHCPCISLASYYEPSSSFPLFCMVPMAENAIWDWTDISMELSQELDISEGLAQASLVTGLAVGSDYIIWSPDFLGRELLVTQCFMTCQSSKLYPLIATLLERVADWYRMTKITIWNPDQYLAILLSESGYTEIDDHANRTPCLWVKDKSREEIQRIRWVLNDAFFWV